MHRSCRPRESSSTATTASARGSVADLPCEIIRCIADRGATECRPRMRAVCSELRAAVPAEPQPWILLQPDDDGVAADNERGSLCVLSLPADRKLSLACCPVAGGLGRARCFGAGHGWLALVGADLGVTLHNPISGAVVSLPPLTKHHMVGHGVVSEDGKVLWRTWLGTAADSRLVPAEEFRDNFVRKVVFSARPHQGEYFAVVLGGYHSYGIEMYARAGATAWKTLRDKQWLLVSLVHDMVHAGGSKFFAVTRSHGKILEIDLAGDGNKFSPPSVSFFTEPLVAPLAESVNHLALGMGMHVKNRLVLVDAKLYQIWAVWEAVALPEEEDPEDKLYRYHIADVTVVRCEKGACWEVVPDLGDWAVLFGRNETVAVRATDMAGLRPSCVYFIDSKLEGGE
ncbi:hypothetical protein BS78_01G420300 [Paspalum vaginatum]|nr:hypothetical protein BS78_01G420300 [Paspalum vaginatum]